MDQKALRASAESYRGRRVLVTGDTGFKGSWLCRTLLLFGADTVGYALPPDNPEGHYSAIGLGNAMAHHDGDLRDFGHFLRVLKDFQPEYVFHLAAQALVRRSFADPQTTFETNVGGSLNVLEAIRQTESVRSLVYITSDKCYRNKHWVWGYRENDELGGDDPYSASKGMAELLFRSYRTSYFDQREDLGAASTRAGNVIGGGDFAEDRIVPDCIRALRKDETIELRQPHATRPWQHVLEPIGGYMHLGAKLREDPDRYSGPWNFGPASGAAKSVLDLTNGILNIWKTGKVSITNDKKTATQESPLLQLNCEKTLNYLDWRAQWDFEKTVERTVLWYKAVHDGQSPDAVTESQIREYFGV